MWQQDGQQAASQSEAALTIIRDRILDLTLAPGSHVDERALMTQYGLGRTPTREALNRLAAEGLVELRVNRGAFVRPLDLIETTQFFDAYYAAERLVAHLCCFDHPRLIEDSIVIQERHAAAIAAGDLLGITRHNADFHLRMAEATGNTYVYDFSGRVHAAARRMLFYLYRSEQQAAIGEMFTGEREGIVGDHHDMIEAMRNGDRATLRDILTRHVRRLQGRLLSVVDRKAGSTFDP